MNRNFNDYKFSPSLKLRSRKITRSAETAQHKAENVTTTTSSSMTVKTHTLPETIETTSESTSMRFGEQTASSLTDISTSHSTNTASNTILNDFNKSDEEELNESIIFPSTISPTWSLASSPAKVERITDLINKLVLDDMNTKQAWSLFETQKGGYKLGSMGFYYVIDKPTLAKIKENQQSKIYWKCENYKFCKGRAVSDGLKPPITHTKKHDHAPEPEKLAIPNI